MIQRNYYGFNTILKKYEVPKNVDYNITELRREHPNPQTNRTRMKRYFDNVRPPKEGYTVYSFADDTHIIHTNNNVETVVWGDILIVEEFYPPDTYIRCSFNNNSNHIIYEKYTDGKRMKTFIRKNKNKPEKDQILSFLKNMSQEDEESVVFSSFETLVDKETKSNKSETEEKDEKEKELASEDTGFSTVDY